jgi:uncharacterized membrane protein
LLKWFSRFCTTCLCAVASIAVSAQSSTTTVAFTAVDCPGAFATQVNDINQHGKLVGFCTNSLGTRGFQFEGGALSLVDVPGAAQTFVIATNSTGTIAGAFYDASGQQHGFSWKEGATPVTIDVPASFGINTLPMGVSDAGDIVGTYQDANWVTLSFLLHHGHYQSITYPGAVSTTTYGINRKAQIVGRSDYTDGFMKSGTSFTPIVDTSGIYTVPTSITNLGKILGYYQAPDLSTHMFLLVNGAFQTIDLLNANLSILHFERFAINDAGQIAGSYQDGAGTVHGFIAKLPMK